MRKSATTNFPRSTSSHFTAIGTRRPSPSSSKTTTTITTKTLPHSTSQQNCRTTTNVINSNSRSRSICSRPLVSTFIRQGTNSATTRELSCLEPILNDDTDSLKIGDRVFVNGQWSGIILYIGETTLGPGEWAGVILENPSMGKTNGIVRGRCYFQTTDNRGIFCRLTKLTRQMLS